MGFFYEDTSPVKPGRTSSTKTIPVHLMRELGCTACPSDRDCRGDHPKLTPTGPRDAQVYILQESIEDEDDRAGDHMRSPLTAEVYKKLPRSVRDGARIGALTQCFEAAQPNALDFCRSRVEADIEETRPELIVGIGDVCLRWAVKLKGNALMWHGTVMRVKIGKHECLYMPIAQPNYIKKKRNPKFPSPYELLLERALASIPDVLAGRWHEVPRYPTDALDGGIVCISGQEAGHIELLVSLLSNMRGKVVGFDIETNALRPWGAGQPSHWRPMVVCCAISDGQTTIAFNLDHPDGWPTPRDRSRVWRVMAEALLSASRVVCHHLGMELEWMCYFLGGEFIQHVEWEDTMLAAHTYQEKEGTKSLDDQVRVHFGFALKELSDIDVKRILTYRHPAVLRYNGLDSKWTVRLWLEAYAPRLRRDPLMDKEYQRKVRLAPALVLTAAPGVYADVEYAQQMGKELDKTIYSSTRALMACKEVVEFERLFGTFNPGSSDDVGKMLDVICKRPEVWITDRKTGAEKLSTSEEILSELPAAEVPSAALVLQLRGVEKLKGTYIEPIIDGRMVCHDGMVRTQYGSAVAETGRLNSEDPNLQNFPKRKHSEIRGTITGGDGFLMPCDYGQIEFRVIGMASEDPELVKACWTGYDVHRYWAERLLAIYPQQKDAVIAEFGVDGDDMPKIIKTLRQEMKNKWVFPQFFGSQLLSCADNLRVPLKIMEELGGEFWDTFRATKKWQEKLIKSYDKNLYVETLGGRRRRGFLSKNEIINTPIQGTAADIVTEAMSAISRISYQLERPTLHPRINVHDDLTFVQYDDTITVDLPIIAREMVRHRFDWVIVPLLVECGRGRRWNECKEFAKFDSLELFNLRNPYA